MATEIMWTYCHVPVIRLCINELCERVHCRVSNSGLALETQLYEGLYVNTKNV